MSPRHAIYQILVNKHAGISDRYHNMHDGSRGIVRILSWLYLLWLNFAYYVLCCRFLGHKKASSVYEQKRLPLKQSESEEYRDRNPRLSIDAFVERLSRYDIISFDVFDTLIFRPVAVPVDVFYFIGQELELMDFKNIRIWAEADARFKYNERHGNMEIGLTDIWDNIHEDVGLDAARGARLEQETEERLCYANPFMLEVWQRLCRMGKTLIIVSDMYLPKGCILRILENAGYTGAAQVYVSCEYHKSKADGKLYREVLKDMRGGKAEPGRASIIHVGDNPHSDQKMARASGLDILPYPNVNRNMILYRAFDLSPMVGSAYRAIVSNWLYCGLCSYSMEYEYGFLYGGLFVLGYCTFIHAYCREHQIEKILFLSRDGDILKKAYDYLYKDEATAYVYWSRKAATKLEALFDKHDYFRRFIYHKVNQGYTIADILHSMELDCLTEQLGDWKAVWTKRQRKRSLEFQKAGKKLPQEKFIDLRAEDELTDKNGYLLRRFIEAKWDIVTAQYATQHTAASRYYGEKLSGVQKAAAVDIGWAGSGAVVLRKLVRDVWNIPCEITGIIAGTNTIHNAEPDASDGFLQSGELVSYMYSAQHNRDLLKKHDPNKDYNIFWELLLSSPTPQFKGFYMSGDSVRTEFGKYDKNQNGIREIQRGILDFVCEYHRHFSDFPCMYRISGRDAYAPMLVAASHQERYLKMIEKRFTLDVNVE